MHKNTKNNNPIKASIKRLMSKKPSFISQGRKSKKVFLLSAPKWLQFYRKYTKPS